MSVEINGNELVLTTGDITQQQTDAIVNAANGSLLGGGGVDGAIHRAAGKSLLEECKRVRREDLNDNYLPVGDVVMTNGYQLQADYVIHTVGPVWNENERDQEKLLADCYRNALLQAEQADLTSIAFPSISTGAFRFPITLAARTALQIILDFERNHNFGQVKVVLFSEEDYEVYMKVLHELTG